jgi:hypothetical protein
VLLFVPSGYGAPWRPDAKDPFDTLPRRSKATGAFEPRAVLEPSRPSKGNTSVHFTEGPASKRAPRLLLLDGEATLGTLEVAVGNRVISAPVGLSALDRGVLFGRYDRCLGATLCDGNVSRVHALLVARAGQLVMLDTGSTNGLFRNGKRVHCEGVFPKAWYDLGDSATVRWTPRAAGNG